MELAESGWDVGNEGLSTCDSCGAETNAPHILTDPIEILCRECWLERELAAMTTRAEAAEAERDTEHEAACSLAAVVMTIAEILGIPESSPDLSQTVIAALRRQLAEAGQGQGWRAVTESPPDTAAGYEYEIKVRGYWKPRYYGDSGAFIANNGAVLKRSDVIQWRPAQD
jgi:hypothetical protein